MGSCNPRITVAVTGGKCESGQRLSLGWRAFGPGGSAPPTLQGPSMHADLPPVTVDWSDGDAGTPYCIALDFTVQVFGVEAERVLGYLCIRNLRLGWDPVFGVAAESVRLSPPSLVHRFDWGDAAATVRVGEDRHSEAISLSHSITLVGDLAFAGDLDWGVRALKRPHPGDAPTDDPFGPPALSG